MAKFANKGNTDNEPQLATLILIKRKKLLQLYFRKS